MATMLVLLRECSTTFDGRRMEMQRIVDENKIMAEHIRHTKARESGRTAVSTCAGPRQMYMPA